MELIETLERAVDSRNYVVLLTTLDQCVETDFDINQLTSTGDGLIHRAVKIDNIAIVILLLKYGAQIDLLNGNELTPLELAVGQGQFDMISFLIKKGASISPGIVSGAVDYGFDEELVEFLLKLGAPIGSAREYVQDLLDQQDESDEDEIERYRGILKVLDYYIDSSM